MKDEVIGQMTENLIEKGKEQEKLAEIVVEMKEQHLVNSVFGHKYLVTRLGSIKSEQRLVRITLINIIIIAL